MLSHHIYYKNSFSVWQIFGYDIEHYSTERGKCNSQMAISENLEPSIPPPPRNHINVPMRLNQRTLSRSG